MLLFVSPGDQAGVPGFNPELRLALKSTGAGGGMGGVNRSYGAQAPRASAGKPMEGRRGLAASSERRGEAGPGALESPTALKSLPRPRPTTRGMQGWVQSPPQRGQPQRQAPGDSPRAAWGPSPHQLQLLTHLCLCLAGYPWTSPEAPLGLSFPICPVLSSSRLATRVKSGLEDRIFLLPEVSKLPAHRRHSVNIC